MISAPRPVRRVLAELACPACRGRRVIMAIVLILLLSLADLYMTMTHLMHAGMLESNPFARGIIEMNSPALLAGWKIGTVTLGLVIFFVARRTCFGELGAIFCVGLLTWLTIRWADYSEQVPGITEELCEAGGIRDGRWVVLSEP